MASRFNHDPTCPVCGEILLVRLRPVWFIRLWFWARRFPLSAYGCATEGCPTASVYLVAVMPVG